MQPTHPDLRAIRFLPNVSWGPRITRAMRRMTIKPSDPGLDVVASELLIPGVGGEPAVSVRVLQPALKRGRTPVLLWVHGGGLIMGSPEQDDRTNMAFVRSLGVTVVAVRYRLAPEFRAPAAAEDVYAALRGIAAHADDLQIDPDRIAIGGASAGGGLAAAAVLIAHDRPGPKPMFQLLVYPMLDDRTVTRTDMDTSNIHVWTTGSNRYGWSAYLGQEPGSPAVSPYAAPARRADLSGLPPTWISVGSNDLFHDEDQEYARRLAATGVPCEFEVVPGAFHGFDALFPKAPVSRRFWRSQAEALARAWSSEG